MILQVMALTESIDGQRHFSLDVTQMFYIYTSNNKTYIDKMELYTCIHL